jgi:uncharacterized integral membrane protein
MHFNEWQAHLSFSQAMLLLILVSAMVIGGLIALMTIFEHRHDQRRKRRHLRN